MEEDHKRISAVAARVSEVAQCLLSADAMDAATIARDTISEERGIYLWRYKDGGAVAYVGPAVGREGLRQRIAGQHPGKGYPSSVFRKAIVSDAGGVPKRGPSGSFEKPSPCVFPRVQTIFRQLSMLPEALSIAALRPSTTRSEGSCQSGSQGFKPQPVSENSTTNGSCKGPWP